MDERSQRIARRFEIPMLVAAVLVIPVIVIEEAAAGDSWRMLAAALNWIIWLAFLTELVVMLVVVPDRWLWIRRHPLEVVVVVLTPPFLPASLQAARVLRLVRLLRLLRVAQLARRVFSLEGLRWIVVLVIIAALGGGAAFAQVEKEGDPTAWDGVWWALTTMTTVGYGDLFPRTDTGRVIGILLMLAGLGFFAILTGAVAQRFLATEVREEVEEAQEEVAEDLDAAKAALLRELRAISQRLQRLEATVARAGRSAR